MANSTGGKSGGPISTDLHDDIRADILSGRLRDGSKLSEASICKKYGVSRTPARQVLFQLEGEGLVQIIPNRGAFVTGLSKRDIKDLFELRSLFEVQAVEWAVKRMSGEQIDKLSETLGFIELYALRGDAARVKEFDDEFHRIIYEGCDDRMIKTALEIYKTYLGSALPVMKYKEEQLKEIFEEHRAIYIAFESKNVKAGRIAMERHMENARKRRKI